MKKKIFLILILLFVVTSGAIIVLQQGQSREKIEQVLPQGAVSYLRVDQLGQKMDTIGQSRFWRSLMAMDWAGIIKKTGASQEVLDQVDAVKRQMSSSAYLQVIKTFFGTESAVAIYPFDLSELDLKDKTKSLSNVFFVTRLKPQASFADFFIKYFAKANKKVSVSQAEYKGQDISIIKVPDGDTMMSISYTQIKDLFVFSFGERAVRDCIDVVQGQVEPLARDPYYLLSQTRSLEKADLQGFLNFEQFVSRFKQQLLTLVPQSAETTSSAQQLDEVFKQLQGIRVLSLSSRFEEAFHSKLDVHYDETALAAELKPFYQCDTKKNATLGFVPEKVVLYQWNACQDWELMWERYQSEAQKAAEVSGQQVDPLAMARMVEQTIGLSLKKDIFPAFGHEMGILFDDVNIEGMFPVPQVTLLLDLQDREKAQKIMDTLLGSQPLFSAQTETYGGENIKYVSIPFVKDLQPAYAFAKGYLFISSSRDRLKEIIDTANGKAASLAASAEFKDVDPGFAQVGNTAFYIRFDKLIDKVRDVLKWSQSANEKNLAKQTAFRKGSEQRLVDVSNKIEELRAEVLEAEGEIAEIKGKGETLNVSPLGRIDQALERSDKFKQKMQKGIDELQVDLDRLLAIKASDTQALPFEGKARIRELKENILKKKEKIKEIDQEMRELGDEKKRAEGQQGNKQALEGANVAVKGAGDTQTVSPVERVEQAIERAEKFRQKMQEGTDKLKFDLDSLLAIEASETQALPLEGKARIQELKDNILKKKEKLAEIDQELQSLREERQQAEAQLGRQETLEEAVEKYQKDIISAQATQRELKEVLAGYEAQDAVAAQRKDVMEEMVYPLLEAVSNFQSMTSRSVFGDNVVENEAIFVLK